VEYYVGFPRTGSRCGITCHVDPKQESALAALASTRLVPGKSWLIPTGMPRASKHDYGNSVTQPMRESADVYEVPCKDLHAVQSGVSAAKVRGLLHHPEVFDRPGHVNDAGLSDDLPIVVRYGGKLYLHDGHHRVVAQRMMGAEQVRVRVVKIDTPIVKWARS
jgi:hypothetical protein